MSCYHPIAAFPDYDAGFTETGNYRYKLSGSYHPEMKKYLDPNVIKIPCGKCLGCQLDKARTWADRMILELNSCDNKGIFLTLTYNNDNVPVSINEDGEFLGFSLDKRDFQLFFKRLRKYFPSGSLRYFTAGEYGSTTFRPHMHSIIFGLSLDYFSDLRKIGLNELGQVYYTSPWLEKVWSKGFICISEVSYKTCSYVARYCTKKAFDYYVEDYLEPEFQLMSRNPGIAGNYYKNHLNDLAYSNIYVNDGDESKKISIPKYFVKKLKVEFPELYDKFKLEDRSKYMNDKELLKLSNTNLSYIDMLENEENELINKTKILFKLREKV